MKLTKENVYVNLQGKTREELTDLWEILNNAGERQYDGKDLFISETIEWKTYLFGCFNQWTLSTDISKTEVTIEQLKQIIKPMGTFTPIAMKCTQEQYEAIKPNLEKLGKIGRLIEAFSTYNYLCNNYGNERNFFDFINSDKEYWNSEFNIIHEEWNEEIFLKACGIEVESLEHQLQKAEAEVKRLQSLIEEENKIKLGDWCIRTDNCIFKVSDNDLNWAINHSEKINDQEIIKKLNELIK